MCLLFGAEVSVCVCFSSGFIGWSALHVYIGDAAFSIFANAAFALQLLWLQLYMMVSTKKKVNQS